VVTLLITRGWKLGRRDVHDVVRSLSFEQKRVMKLVKAIREGRILPYKAPEEREDKEEELINRSMA
jgi:hypothetical protein